jgi:hypothetical protein
MLRRVLACVLVLLGTAVSAGVTGAAPQDFRCQIHVIGYATDGVVGVGGCKVTLKAMRLVFSTSERGDLYDVQNGIGVHSSRVRPSGSGSKVLTLRFPTPLQPGGDMGRCMTHFVLEAFVPPVPLGGKITVTLIATDGTTQTVDTTVRPLSHCS